MPADINTYAGDGAWHGLGYQLSEADRQLSLEDQFDLLVAKAWNWDVDLIDCITVHGTPISTRAVVRQDTGVVIGNVGPDYTLLSTSQITELFRRLILGNEGLRVSDIGTLGDGARLFITAELGEPISILPGDELKTHVALTSSHDGSWAVRTDASQFRVVCANTAKRFNEAARFSIKHTTNVLSRVEGAISSLGVALADYKHHASQFADAAAMMANAYPQEAEIEEVLKHLFPETEDAKRDTWSRPRAAVRTLFREGEHNNLPGMEGTAWSLYNAATEYIDWHGSKTPEKRYLYASQGGGAELREQAFEYVMALV